MNLTIWQYSGITILALDVLWMFFYYSYATVKVYNFHKKNNSAEIYSCKKGKRKFESEEYLYLGSLLITQKRHRYELKIPQEMIENSQTTKYKIVVDSFWVKWKKREKIHINFADEYDTEETISAEITVKNYIATSHQL